MLSEHARNIYGSAVRQCDAVILITTPGLRACWILIQRVRRIGSVNARVLCASVLDSCRKVPLWIAITIIMLALDMYSRVYFVKTQTKPEFTRTRLPETDLRPSF